MLTEYMLARSRHFYRLSREGQDSFHGAYNDAGHEWKEEWLKTGRSVLRAIGKELKFDDMKVWINRGGVAVTGEVHLMGMWHMFNTGIYLDTASPVMGYSFWGRDEGPEFMWRKISHMKDFSGDRNRWLPYKFFLEPNKIISELLSVRR